MDEPGDIALLREFVEQRSEFAFAELVRRHIDLVYSTALRQTRNPQAGEDISQAVFVILSHKAGSLLRLTTLTGWLYQAARLTARNYLRTEARRARREQEAYMQSLMNESSGADETTWTQCTGELEDAMGKLSADDRCAILLRYFQNKSLHEVGLALGTNEDASRMRINRALDKLRRFFEKRGVRLSAIALAGALSTKSVQAAPAGLAASISSGIAQGAVIGGSVAALAQATLKILAWARLKTLLGLSATTISVAAVITTIFILLNNAGTQQATSLGTRIAKVAPFQGTVTEAFDHLGSTEAKQQISIFGGTVTVSNRTRGGSLKLVYSSELGGVLVTSRSSPFMLGQLGISEWVFHTPITRFGAYFQNNSRFDDATVDFYDVNNHLIESVTAGIPKALRAWTWNGWQSDVPIRRVVVTGNDTAFLNGFIWFDDVTVTTVPPPPAIIIRPMNNILADITD